jgi:hypothetical protein
VVGEAGTSKHRTVVAVEGDMWKRRTAVAGIIRQNPEN